MGSTPSTVDLWDVETRNSVSSFSAGSTLALSPDAHLLATNGKDIQVLDLASAKVIARMPWGDAAIWRMSFDPSGTRLIVRANGENDTVFNVKTGEKVASLTNTQEAQFSSDGLLAIGANAKHIISWNTKDWSQARDLPNGPDYVTRFAVSPGKDLVVVGGPNLARLIRLNTGEEVAKLSAGYTNFVAFDQTGSFIFTYAASGFGVWDTTGKLICTTKEMGNGTMAISPNGRWLAADGGGRDVKLWRVENILNSCRK